MSSACSGHAPPVFRSTASLVARLGSRRSGTPRTRSIFPESVSSPPRSCALTGSSVIGAISRRSSRSGGNDPWNKVTLRTTSIRRSSCSEPVCSRQNSANRSSRSDSRAAAVVAISWGSIPSRAPTSTSMALWTSTPAAVLSECSNGGSSRSSRAANRPSHRASWFSASFPSQSGSPSSSSRAALSILSTSRCRRSAAKTGRSSVPIRRSSVRRCGSVRSIASC